MTDGKSKVVKGLILISYIAFIIYVAFPLEIHVPCKRLHREVISLVNNNCVEQTENSEFHISALDRVANACFTFLDTSSSKKLQFYSYTLVQGPNVRAFLNSVTRKHSEKGTVWYEHHTRTHTRTHTHTHTHIDMYRFFMYVAYY